MVLAGIPFHTSEAHAVHAFAMGTVIATVTWFVFAVSISVLHALWPRRVHALWPRRGQSASEYVQHVICVMQRSTDHVLHILGLLGIWPASIMTSESMVPISGSCHKSLSLEMSLSRMGFLRSPMPSHAPAQHAPLVTEPLVQCRQIW